MRLLIVEDDVRMAALLKRALEEDGYAVDVSGDDAEQLVKLVETLEEDDDIQTVWGNYEMSEEVMERLA